MTKRTNTNVPVSLNPFENQVYFYAGAFDSWATECLTVLIPLRIRSISTSWAFGESTMKLSES